MEISTELPEVINIWEVLNSNGLATFVGMVATIVVGLVGRGATKEIAENNKVVSASRGIEDNPRQDEEIRGKENESLEPTVQFREGPDGTELFDRASDIHKRIREHIDYKIQRIRDGRKARKYNIGKYDYRLFINLLLQDDKIEQKEAEVLYDAISQWFSFRPSPKEMTRASFNIIAEAEKYLPQKPG